MKENRFVFLIGSYNNEEYVESNLGSILFQTYGNYKIVYYNAGSKDGTKEEVLKNSPKFGDKLILFSTEERNQKGWFFDNVSSVFKIEDNDIVCILDGDDFLSNIRVLEQLNDIYNTSKCWMTYGGMVTWKEKPEGGQFLEQPFPQNSEFPNEVGINKLYRKDLWRYSHFRTMRGFLWNKLESSQWKSSDGSYIGSEDLVMMYQALEMCRANKIYRIPTTMYIYNELKGSRHHIENNVQSNIGRVHESEIRNRPVRNEIEYVSPKLQGGLGNMMFQVSAAHSLAERNGAICVVNTDLHHLPNQGNNVKTYTDNVFRKLITSNSLGYQHSHSYDSNQYMEIPYKKNMLISGYFQSFKYFSDSVKELFSCPDEIKSELMKIPVDFNETTLIQVRRGDYVKFPDIHPLQSIGYYFGALEYTEQKHIIIISDDIEWCKENFKFLRNAIFISQKDYVDLYLISLCKNNIISNSSFGWWGAYLNANKNKCVVAPSNWYGKKITYYHEDLIPSDWKII